MNAVSRKMASLATLVPGDIVWCRLVSLASSQPAGPVRGYYLQSRRHKGALEHLVLLPPGYSLAEFSFEKISYTLAWIRYDSLHLQELPKAVAVPAPSSWPQLLAALRIEGELDIPSSEAEVASDANTIPSAPSGPSMAAEAASMRAELQKQSQQLVQVTSMLANFQQPVRSAGRGAPLINGPPARTAAVPSISDPLLAGLGSHRHAFGRARSSHHLPDLDEEEDDMEDANFNLLMGGATSGEPHAMMNAPPPLDQNVLMTELIRAVVQKKKKKKKKKKRSVRTAQQHQKTARRRRPLSLPRQRDKAKKTKRSVRKAQQHQKAERRRRRSAA